MASREAVTLALKSFSLGIKKREISDELIDTYHQSFKNTDEDKFIKACHRCLDDCDYFPQIHAIRARISYDTVTEDRDFYLAEKTRCSNCGKVTICIKEPKDSQFWECRECYSGLTNNEINKRFKGLGGIMRDKKYCPEWVKELAGRQGCSDSLQARIDRGLSPKGA